MIIALISIVLPPAISKHYQQQLSTQPDILIGRQRSVRTEHDAGLTLPDYAHSIVALKGIGDRDLFPVAR
jgi:hypothetical protein